MAVFKLTLCCLADAGGTWKKAYKGVKWRQLKALTATWWACQRGTSIFKGLCHLAKERRAGELTPGSKAREHMGGDQVPSRQLQTTVDPQVTYLSGYAIFGLGKWQTQKYFSRFHRMHRSALHTVCKHRSALSHCACAQKWHLWLRIFQDVHRPPE